ncbi:MAG TPA: hypothetical protein DD670_15795 [Planctomycetaceae bacterium]|nr:hypothetical protein [Planctomycetaceae bacterium]
MNEKSARKPTVRGFARRFPFTLGAIVFSGFVITFFASVAAGLLDSGSIPGILKPLFLPGVLIAYSLGVATDSKVVLWTGFALGVILFYGFVGVILDILLRVSLARDEGRGARGAL